MDARTALTEVQDALSDAQSLIETLEPEDGGDRLDQYRYPEALGVLDKLVNAAAEILTSFEEWGVEGYYDADEQERMRHNRTAALEELNALITPPQFKVPPDVFTS